MSREEILDQLLALKDEQEKGEFLRVVLSDLDEREINALVEELKEKVIEFQRADIQRAIQTAELIIKIAEITGNPSHGALGLRAEAQARVIGLGQYQEALPLYDEALSIYDELGDEVGRALVEGTRIWALAALGRYDEAIRAGDWAHHILKTYDRWRDLATLNNNLAWIYQRNGNSKVALSKLEIARSAYQNLGEEGEPFLANNEINRAYVCFSLGQFEAASQASQIALEMATKFGQTAVMARAQHCMAIIHYHLGRFNDALNLFQQARDTHLAIGQPNEAALCDLSITECLLELRRFNEVLKTCQRVYSVFSELGMRIEAANTLRNQAKAYASLRQYDQAITSLNQARQLFAEQESTYWCTRTDLETAVLMHQQGLYAKSLIMAENCATVFKQLGHLVEETQSRVVAARAAFALGQYEPAKKFVEEVLIVTKQKDLPALAYQGRVLLGRLAQERRAADHAILNYGRAIRELERLFGNVMVEHRPDFLGDKHEVYENIVDLYLDKGQPGMGLEYVERAKSRSLLNILAFRPDLSLHARIPEDEPIVAMIKDSREERERLLRSGRSLEGQKLDLDPSDAFQVQQRVRTIEDQITALWHKLLVRNADYAQDASLWQVRTEPVQPYLGSDAILIEYFSIGEELEIFLVTSETGKRHGIQVFRLPTPITRIKALHQRLFLNFLAVPRSRPDILIGLITNAQKILNCLYQALIEPVFDKLMDYHRLIIVPHGPLHYLPFHALYDGEAYLIERFEISYLPASSFLRYYTEAKPSGQGVLSAGLSYDGQLPYAEKEAAMVAEIFGGQPLLGEGCSLSRVRAEAPHHRLLHLATHGDFRPDNPLFSGLALADGWLTTLDIFDLPLEASLVTLSACQTGRSVVSGGDELLGLVRAFLAAGAASLVLSQWVVEDVSTSVLMHAFYQHLARGETKGAALGMAQRSLIQGEGTPHLLGPTPAGTNYVHPYYWAPFFLVGDTDVL